MFYMKALKKPPKEKNLSRACCKRKFEKKEPIRRTPYLLRRCPPLLSRIVCFQRSHNP